MNFTERELIKKAGADSGWSIIEAETPDSVTLGSASHDEQATIECDADQMLLSLTVPIGATKFPDKASYRTVASKLNFKKGDYESLRIVLYHLQKHCVTLPPKPVESIEWPEKPHENIVSPLKISGMEKNAPQNPVELYQARLKEIIAKGISATETEEIVKQRVGQDLYRELLMNYWQNACAVTGCKIAEALRASHAKPWKDCLTAEERLNVYNGFLLTANLDALFDKGLISFKNDGRMMISSHLNDEDLRILGIHNKMHLRWIETSHLPYLQYHREHVWKV